MPCIMKLLYATPKLGLIALFLTLFSVLSFAQTGTLEGVITDASTGELAPQIEVRLLVGDSILLRAITDFNGVYQICGISPGEYDVLCVGGISYRDKKFIGVNIVADQPTVLSTALECNTQLMVVEIEYTPPLIQEGQTLNVTRVTNETYIRTPNRSTHAVSSLASGSAVQDGSAAIARGTRADANVVFVDGVKVQGSSSLPQAAYDASAPELPENENRFIAYEMSPFQRPAQSPLSTFGMDVDRASYYNVKRLIEEGYDVPPAAVRTEEFLNAFGYEYHEPEKDEVFHIESEYSECAWNPNHNLLRLTINTERIDRSELPPSNYVFLVDVSGSMNSPDKLALAQEALRMLARQLTEEDRISIVTYAGRVSLALESTPGDEKATILQAIDRLSSGGSTNGAGGIQMAYEQAEAHFIDDGNNRIVLCTDGDFNVGISNRDELLELIETKRESGVYLSVIGFGRNNYNEGTMEQLANHGNGNMNYMYDRYDARRVMTTEMVSTMFTVAKDAKIQIEFNPLHVFEYRLIGYENRALADEEFDMDEIDAGEVGIGHQVTALFEIVPGPAIMESDLRYQQSQTATIEEELAFLSIRYKAPDEDESVLRDYPISTEIQDASEDQRFTMGVAAFAGMLREDEHIQMNLEDIIVLTRSGVTEEDEATKNDFIQLTQLYRDLMANNH